MKNEILKHAISDWNITKCEELLAIGDVDTNAVIHSRVGVYHDSLDENGYPIPVFIDYTILMHAIDYGSAETVRLLVNAGADFRLKYPYGPNSNGNLLDRVMSIAEEVTFCVPQVVEKATFLISKGLRPIKTLASDSNFSSPDFVIIASNFNIHCDKTIHFIDALKNRNYFESGELQTLCEELLTGKKQQIAAILECSTLPLDVCKLISSFTKPMRCQKDLKSVGFFKQSHHDHAPVTKNVHSYKPCVIS